MPRYGAIQEFLKSVTFAVPDHEELRAVRDGAWSYDVLVDWADTQTRHLRGIVDHGEAVVPPAPDRDAIDAFAQRWVARALGCGEADTGPL